MGIVVTNTQTGLKEDFQPWRPPQVKMYCCGPTVYDLLHVGNFRGAVFYNLVRNWLEHRGYKVTMVYNYTDVDDKIINRANERQMEPMLLAEKFINEFETDFRRLGLRPHDQNPRVSHSMPEILAMIESLISQGKAYATSRGDVWYSVKSFPEYGKLSHRQIEDLRSGDRIDVDSSKKDPLDFALWKHAKPGEPSWPSAWGAGRPGWHIECSAMANKHLGARVDIHGGGIDLIFPHHENEIAQSEGATGEPYVKYWLHNNMINFGGSKMSKSVGNIVTARFFMDTHHPEIFKFLMLASHYRSVTDLSDANIELAVKGLARIYSALALADEILAGYTGSGQPLPKMVEAIQQADKAVGEALDDDFGTPEVMARIFEMVRLFNSEIKTKWTPGKPASDPVGATARALQSWIHKVGAWMALFQEPPAQFLRSLDDKLLENLKLSRTDIDKMVAERTQAKQARDFKKADELRGQLVKLGISVMDTAQGSIWEVAK